MGTRGGDVLAPRKPYSTQLARHPTYPDPQGVVEEGRGRTSASKVSKIAGMFQGGGGGGGGGSGGGGGGGGGSVRGVAGDDDTAPGGSQEASGPQHATVVRTESHLARFNTARALFEKMGQSEGGIAQPPRAAPSSAALSSRVPPPAGFGGKVGAGLAKAQDKGESEGRRAGVTVGRVGAATHQFGRRSGSEERPGGLGSRVGRGESLSPARSLGGASTSSSRSGSPSPARTNGHAHHSDQDSGGGGPGGGPGTGGELVGGLAGLRRPGSSSSRSLSTSSTESEPTSRRWPPHTASSSGRPAAPLHADASSTSSSSAAAPSRPETFKSDLTAELRRAPRPEKPEKPAKPESLDRRSSTHEQHQELIARHKNWFQSFSKSRSSPTASPSKPDCRPTSPSKAAEWEPRPPSPSKADGRGPQPSKSDLRSPRGAERNEEATAAEKKEEEERGGGGGGGGKGLVSEQDAWSSVLQNRYGTKAKDILSPRARSEGEATADWRKERAAILSGRTGQRHNDSEDDVSTLGKGQAKLADATRFEDAATLQSGWSPPQYYGQESQPSAGVKTLKEEINVAETERAKMGRQAVKENGSAHEGVEGETVENIVALEKKEKADLIVSESVVLKDSSKEKDQEKKPDGTSYYASVSSTTSVVSSRLDELRGGRKPWTQSKETTEEVNIKLKESISGGQTTTTAATSLATTVTAEVPEKRDFRKEFEERRERRRQQREAEEEEERARIARREESRRKREEASELRKKEELEIRKREEAKREEARRLRKERSEERSREKSEDRKSEGERERSKERRGEREREGSKERQDVERESSKERLVEGERERSKDLRREVRPRERSGEGKDRYRREERARESSEEKVRSPRREKETKAKEAKEEIKREKEEEEAKNEAEEVKETVTKDTDKEEIAPAPSEVPPPAIPTVTEDTPPAQAAAEAVDAAAPESEKGAGGDAETVVVGGVVGALKAETVYVSSSEDLSLHDDSRRDLSVLEDPKGDLALLDEAQGELPRQEDSEASPPEPVPEVEVIVSTVEDESELPEAQQEAPKEEVGEQLREGAEGEEKEAQEEANEKQEQEGELESPVKRQLFPDVVSECEGREADPPVKREGFRPKWAEPGAPLPEEVIAEMEVEGRVEAAELTEVISPPLSPRAQSLAALDALIHGHPQGVNAHDQAPPTSPSAALEPPPPILDEEEEIVYDHTVTSAQHKLQFCTTPVTVEGIAPDQESHGTDPEPLPPPIPPHGIDPATVAGVDVAQAARPLIDPEVMTPEEAQRLLSAKEGQTLLSDEEAQEVVLLLSPQEKDAPQAPPPVPPHYSDIPSMVPPHYADVTPPVPPHYGPAEDEYDMRLASRFDPTLTSPLSPEEEPSEADSSEASGDVSQVSRAKEVLVEDGVHYLEDGHFWVEVPGLPEEDEEDELDPTLPFHQHTRLTFSKDPIQVFSTYSVTEYDRKNDEVDPVAASAEYELEKRVEKMDVFPVEIVKGEGGLGLSIIGMGVGADAGVEKLGIFVKTITPGGATERDARIQVNDQIIEVDGKSLVGVTQVFAASVLKNTSGRVHFLIGREKDPENSEVALLIKQSLQADMEREERRRALGGPDYDPHANHGLFDPLSSPSEENSRSEDMSMHHNNYSYMEGGSSPTSPDAVSPPAEVFDLEGDTSDTSPDNDVAMLKLKLKEVQYRNAVAEAEIQKLKMKLLDMEKILEENNHFSSQLRETRNQMSELEEKLQAKTTEVSTYQDMLEQSQGQYIVLEKKYYKAKKIIKEYQGRERDFLHREEYHITQLEDKDSHYNALVKALKDRVISLEAELTNAQKTAGLPVQVPADANTQPAYWQLQQSAQSAKMPVKEELDEAVPPHELLDVSASRAKGELAARGGLANRHLPSLKKTTSMSSAGSQDHSLDDSSLDDDLPESQKHVATEPMQDLQQDLGIRRSADILESPLPPPQSILPPSSMVKSTKTPPPPPPYSHLGSPPPYQHPPGQFSSGRQPLAPSHALPDPPSSLPMRPLGAGMDGQPHHDTQSESRPEIPYRHPPPVARVLPVNRAEISESSSLASHLANRTPQQQSLAEQLKALLAERDLQTDSVQQRNDRDVSPNKRSPTSLMEDVRQAVLQADVSSHVVPSGQMVHQLGSPQRTQPSVHYTPSGRESQRESNTGSGSPRLGRSNIHSSSVSSVSSSPSGVVLLSQRPLDPSLPTHKVGPGVDGSSGDLSSGPASLGSGDEGSGASLGSQSSLSLSHPPTERSKRSHMWQTTPVVDWSKEQVNQWLIVQGLEGCVGRFQEIGITGPRLLNLDVRDLKALGLAPDDKSRLKRKVKELRIAVEKERKQVEKEKKEREKLQKKAEKLAEKAEKKKK